MGNDIFDFVGDFGYKTHIKIVMTLKGLQGIIESIFEAKTRRPE